MSDAPDSTNRVIPPFSPLRVQIEPPEKKRRRGGRDKKRPKHKPRKGEGNPNRGKAVDVVV